MNIREYIKKNFKNSSIEELRESIEESVQSEDEIVLPEPVGISNINEDDGSVWFDIFLIISQAFEQKLL